MKQVSLIGTSSPPKEDSSKRGWHVSHDGNDAERESFDGFLTQLARERCCREAKELQPWNIRQRILYLLENPFLR